ncbi:hypothetical protein KC19_7G081500, partial [Ceratodon purpureus]
MFICNLLTHLAKIVRHDQQTSHKSLKLISRCPSTNFSYISQIHFHMSISKPLTHLSNPIPHVNLQTSHSSLKPPSTCPSANFSHISQTHFHIICKLLTHLSNPIPHVNLQTSLSSLKPT